MLKKLIDHIRYKLCPVKEFLVQRYNRLESLSYYLQYLSVNLPTQHWVQNMKEILPKKTSKK